MSFTLRHIRPYSARAALYVLLEVFSVVFTMATALSVADFLKILFGDSTEAVPSVNIVASWLDGLYAWLVSFGRRKALVLFSAIIFVLYSLKNVFGYLSTLQIATLRVRVVRDLRNAMFRKAMRLPMRYYDRARKGDVMARFSSDMVEYDEGLLASLHMLVSAVISMTMFLSMLLYLNVKLTLFVLCMLPLVAFAISGISRRLRRNSQVVQEMNSHLISLTDETIGGLKVIKSYTAIDFSNRRFRSYNRRYTHLRNAMYLRIEAASPISEFLGTVIVVGILLFGSMLVLGGDQGLTSELFISYVMMFVLMIPPAKNLTSAIAQIKKGQACADRIKTFLDEPEEPSTPSPAPSLKHSSTQAPKHSSAALPALQFRNVDFSYTDGIPVLHQVSFNLPKGSTLAIVGASGSGKSTIADLICRFYEADSGEILLAGQPIATMPLAELRGRIAVVAQDTLLFNDSVEANIAFGCPSASHDQIMAAAQAAQAHEFISLLPDGYNTRIGEGGSLLSGGQRQRLSIARALLRSPELLILDEATSALDTENERLLQLTLDQVLHDRSAVVIAHRLSTIVGADNIVVLDHGRIIEQGTHASLMALGGKYAELVAMQSL